LRLFEEGETSLVRLEFLRSGRSVGKNIEREDDVPLATKVAQPDAIALVIRELKVRSGVTNLEWRHG
jgi:hypothetical protein